MRHEPYRHVVRMEGGAELHTRKGWRGMSRPLGTNRRRALIPVALQYAPLSRASRLTVPKTLWGRFKAAAVEWVNGVRETRITAERDAIAKALAEAAVKPEPYTVATRK